MACLRRRFLRRADRLTAPGARKHQFRAREHHHARIAERSGKTSGPPTTAHRSAHREDPSYSNFRQLWFVSATTSKRAKHGQIGSRTKKPGERKEWLR